MLSFKIIFEIILVFWRCLMKIYRLGVLLLVLLFAAASPAVASNWYIGGGIESVTLGEDVDFVDNGGGLAFNFGIRFTSVTALDFTFSSSTHEEAGVDIDYGKFGVGPKFFFSDGSFQPFATVGIMSHVLDYQNVPYQIDGVMPTLIPIIPWDFRLSVLPGTLRTISAERVTVRLGYCG
jgi:hypothetical protein